MSIVRITKNKNYTAVSNIPANDSNLSFEARGVLFYLLTKPNSWTLMVSDLMANGKIGQKKVRKILSELETSGYLKRTKKSDKEGQFYWESEVFEQATMLPKSIDGEGMYGGSTMLPFSIDGEGSHIVSNELVNTDNNIKENYKKKKTPKELDCSMLPEKLSTQTWKDYVQHRKELKAPLTQTVVNTIAKELRKSQEHGISPDDAMGIAMTRGWKGFKATWIRDDINTTGENYDNNKPADEARRPGRGGAIISKLQSIANGENPYE